MKTAALFCLILAFPVLLGVGCSNETPTTTPASTGNVAPSRSTPAARAYAVVVVQEGDVISIGGEGNPLLSKVGLVLALKKAAEEGWQVHSVVPVVSGSGSISISGGGKWTTAEGLEVGAAGLAPTSSWSSQKRSKPPALPLDPQPQSGTAHLMRRKGEAAQKVQTG